MAIGTTSNMEWLSGPGGGSVEYTAGHGIVIDNYDHIISTDQSVVQDKLTAGDNITITNNVISAADQVQSDWAESDTSSPAYIANKPTIPTKTSDLTNDSNFITAADVPSAQVQSDWNETDSSDPAYIVNKPTIPSGNQLLPAATSADEDKVLTVDSNGDPEWAPAQTFTQVQANWNETDSSAVSFIQNKPTIPTKTSDLQNDSNYITASDVPGAQVQSDWTESNTSSPAYIAHKPSLATVATSGSYNDLSDQPTIPSGNQLLPPATSSDEDKVLMVDSNGDPVWDNPTAFTQQQSDWTQTNNQAVDYIKHKPGAKPVLAGPGIQITETSSDITISTTTLSGISEIQYVQSLPANPVSGVLYLIPLT